jgi:hypothetical protein
VGLTCVGGLGAVRGAAGRLLGTVGPAVAVFAVVVAGGVFPGAAARLPVAAFGPTGLVGNGPRERGRLVGGVVPASVVTDSLFFTKGAGAFEARSPRRSLVTTPATKAARTIAAAIVHNRVLLRRETAVPGKAAGTAA